MTDAIADLVIDQDEITGPILRSLDVLARSLHVKEASLEPTLAAIVTLASETLRPARHAGLILVENGRLIPQATTGRPPDELDALQQRLGEGPCLDSAERQVTNRIDDLTADTRWPAFAAAAVKLNVCGLLCVPLWVDERRLGALTLYADHPAAFDDADEQFALIFGTLAALALADAQRVAQLRTALANRDVIGQAKGILMERHRITADAAFERLARASQRANKKLIAIAGELTTSGELPEG